MSDQEPAEPALTLRPASEADEHFLFELRKATMTVHLAQAGESIDDAQHRVRLLHRYDAARVICLDGAPAGLLKAYRTETEWVVVQLQIAPAHQGHGIGERALRTVLLAAQADALPVTLKVLKGNPARRLYQRLGFEIVDEDEIQFHMRCTPHASAQTQAEWASDKDGTATDLVMTFRDTSAIQSWHAHVYFDSGSRDAAWTFREQIEAHWNGKLQLGRFHERPVGPHPMWSYQLAFEQDQFAELVGWLTLNHGALDIFLHPNTGDSLRDHRDAAIWIGHSHDLVLSALN